MPEILFQPLGDPTAAGMGLATVADIDPRLTRTHYFDGRLLTAAIVRSARATRVAARFVARAGAATACATRAATRAARGHGSGGRLISRRTLQSKQ